MSAHNGFRQNVLEFVRLLDANKQDNKALAQTPLAKTVALNRKRLKELKASIIEHMTSNNIEQCNLSDGALLLKASKAPPPLSSKLICEALQAELGPEGAAALASKVSEHRESAVQTRAQLKRTRARLQLPEEPAPPAVDHDAAEALEDAP